MNYIDIISVILLIVYLYTGYKKGFLYTVLVSMRFFLSIILSKVLMDIYGERLLQEKKILEIIDYIKRIFFRKYHSNSEFLLKNDIVSEKIEYYILYILLFLLIMVIAIILFRLMKVTFRTGVLKKIEIWA